MDSIVSRELVDGLGAGAVAACGAAGAYFVVRPRHTLAVGGLLFALAGVVALGWWRGVPTALAVGLAGVAGATAIVGWARLPLWSAAIAVLPFAWLIAERGGLPRVGWVRVVAIVVICVVGLLAAVGDDVSSAPATGPILLAITTAGVYVCTPDTEEVRTLLGVALALMILGWPLRWIRLGRAGAVSAVGLLTWAAAVDARGRPSTFLGAAACIATLGITPFVAASPRFRRAVFVIAAHVALIAIAVVATRTYVAPHRSRKAPKVVHVRNAAQAANARTTRETLRSRWS